MIRRRRTTTNYVIAKIHKTQQNTTCRLCGERDEMVTHMISKCDKLAQKEYKSRHKWMGKVKSTENCSRDKNLAMLIKDIYTDESNL